MKRGNMTRKTTDSKKGYDRYETGEVSTFSDQVEVPPHLRKMLNAKLAARALAKR